MARVGKVASGKPVGALEGGSADTDVTGIVQENPP
jgi:hypothetical protein